MDRPVVPRSRRSARRLSAADTGRTAGDANDEALELRRLLPDVPHVQNADRVAAARKAVAEFGCRAIVLDDGFQHRRIARDFDIVLLDALAPFGFGTCLSAGHAPRADRGAAAGRRRRPFPRRLARPGPARGDLANRPRPCPRGPFAPRRSTPRGSLISAGGERMPLDEMWDQPVAALCGIGNPAGFRHTLEQCGCQACRIPRVPRPPSLYATDVRRLARWADGLDVSAVLCTCKDLVKLAVDRLGDKPLWAVRIEIEFLTGQAPLESRLRRLCSV